MQGFMSSRVVVLQCAVCCPTKGYFVVCLVPSWQVMYTACHGKGCVSVYTQNVTRTSVYTLVPCTGRALGPSPAWPCSLTGWAGLLLNLLGRAGPTFCGPGLKKY